MYGKVDNPATYDLYIDGELKQSKVYKYVEFADALALEYFKSEYPRSFENSAIEIVRRVTQSMVVFQKGG